MTTRICLTIAAGCALFLAQSGARADEAAAESAPSAGVLGAPVGEASHAFYAALNFPTSSVYSLGFRFADEGSFGFMDLSPRLRLDVAVRASLTHHTFMKADKTYDGTAIIVDFLPALRVKYALAGSAGLFVDYGLGLDYFLHTDRDDAPSDNSLSYTVQAALGLLWAINPSTNLIGEVRALVYPRSGGSLFFAVPTVGVQFH